MIGKESYSSPIRCGMDFPMLISFLLIAFISACQTTGSTPTSSNVERVSKKPNNYQPTSNKDIQLTREPFSTTLPFGIGARLDLFFSETGEKLSPL